MTVLIIFLAITNMAVGYGLAVYLGQGHRPLQISVGRIRQPKVAVNSPSAATSEPRSAPVESGDRVDSRERSSGDPEEQAHQSEPPPVAAATPRSEADAVGEQTNPEPVPQPMPQLDVSDLMPHSEPAPESAPLEDSAGRRSQAVPVDQSVDESEEPTAGEAFLAASAEIPLAADSVDATVTAEVVRPETVARDNSDDVLPQPGQEVATTQPEEPLSTATLEKLPRNGVSEEDDPPEEAAAEAAAEVSAQANATDELEFLAQQLQAAVAQSSDHEEGGGDDGEFAAAETAACADVIDQADERLDAGAGTVGETVQVRAPSETSAGPESAPAEDHVTAKSYVSGLELFQQQLQQQSVERLDTTVGPDLDQSYANDSHQTVATSETTAVLPGSEAFQDQLPAQQRDSQESQATPEVGDALAGIAAFQAQLLQQATAPPSSAESPQADGADLEPEIFAGIESFRTQLAQMNTSAEAVLPGEAEDEGLLETAAAR